MKWQTFPPRFLRRLSWSMLGGLIAVAIALLSSDSMTIALESDLSSPPINISAPQANFPTILLTPPRGDTDTRNYTDAQDYTDAQSYTDARNHLSLGRTAYSAGRFAEAIEHWQIAHRSATVEHNIADQIMSLNGLSSAYQALNAWEQAKEANEQSRTLLRNTHDVEPILWGQTLNTYASLLLNEAGRAEAALATWQQAASYYEQAGDTIGQLGCEINQAEALKHLGFYRRARKTLEAIHDQLIILPDSAIKIAGFRSLGKALQLIGQPQESYQALAEGLTVARRINAVTEISSLQLRIGKLSAEMGNDPATALAYFQAAEDSALTPGDQLQARLDQLALYVETDNLETIKPLTLTIQEQLTLLPPSRITVYGAVNLAHTLSSVPSNYSPLSNADISQLLAQSIRVAESLQDYRGEAYALQQMGQLYRQTQQWSDAIALTQQSLNIAENIHSADIISQAAWQLGKLHKQVHQRTKAISAYTQAVNALKALRGDLVAINQDVQFSYREQVEPVYRELVGLLIEEKSQQSLEQARMVLEALQVAELDNFFQEACLDLQVSQIDQIDPNATVIYTIMLPDRLATIYSQTGQSLQLYETAIDHVELEKNLRSLLASLHLSSDQTERLHYSQTLYNLLIRPAEEANILTPNQPLVFVLDGLLRNIPMAALYDGQQYLIEKYAIALSPGLQLMQSESLQSQDVHALVAGISQARGQFSALPSVKDEVKEISRWLPSSQLLDSDFTRNAITYNLTNNPVNIVHLATHGQFSSNFNETFFLTWDDTININELSEILQSRATNQQSAIELLTLSACETARGDDRAVLGLAGLAVRSGARSTIATLWPIKDDVAKQLMTTFYRHLKQSSLTKAESLRQAQLELIHSDSFNDPFFWSAYVLIGNWL